ncbi:hypothetical protein SERLADRAFT_473336 [Serpula lacrymans var. lacrymans S7.9]|uniref:Uncharacterized protein n=1 Tax=Serpula lacrymans var. lacrymans (strain S7.9) TaxID=578457 RepID=F8P2T6_SERL9|nr:uncharacterized protein SERLADRAFT_473336 [Serpula lacrymans var. lacrymans S7.9]EGO22471.1 hypothetical protein SERLADRAFT_473336 [Serpula lacrymans var. lacrymans S7.9]
MNKSKANCTRVHLPILANDTLLSPLASSRPHSNGVLYDSLVRVPQMSSYAKRPHHLCMLFYTRIRDIVTQL